MKQAGYSKRPHGRPPERHRQPQTKQSSGTSTDSKMRGSPQQCVEKYLILARDATSLGDPVSAENYYQFADHYYRLVVASRISRSPRSEKRDGESENQNERERESQTASAPLAQQSENWLE